MGDLFCELTSNAPIFVLQNEPVSVSEVIASEIMDFLAQDAVKLAGHEDELYAQLIKARTLPVIPLLPGIVAKASRG